MLLLAHVLPALTANGDDQLVERGIADLFARGTGAARQRAARLPMTEPGSDDLGHIALAAARAVPVASTHLDAARPRTVIGRSTP
ncbi:hypothetical protein [Curtobacterium sp. MCPF17_052]|uniref:hypothetical protein n=1 Tax=Curtobacterium sp. MCPF17_052 TaxID=2175655 RepID=UPI0024E035F8|nr:hypothetical protein [Curtobacterium sp. MCPF17_052]WIB14057.1 hypothetical protein DEJ36_09995 [Curtobacterium sp. MCPF17_052]